MNSKPRRRDRSTPLREEAVTTVVGVDYSTYEAVLCAIPFSGGKPRIAHARFRPAKASGDVAAILALDEVAVAIRGALDEIAPLDEPEVHVYFVERGFGASRRADFIMGAFFGSIRAAFRLLDPDSPVNSMEAREWKAAVTGAAGIGLTKAGKGNANAKKEVANEAARALLGLVEVDGTDWTNDELDAYGVAWTGRRLNAKAAAAA